MTGLVTLANAGVQARLLSALRTARTVRVCDCSAVWLGACSTKPLSAELKVQLGEPKLHVVAARTEGEMTVAPMVALPTVVIWKFLVTELLPRPMTKREPEPLPLVPGPPAAPEPTPSPAPAPASRSFEPGKGGR